MHHLMGTGSGFRVVQVVQAGQAVQTVSSPLGTMERRGQRTDVSNVKDTQTSRILRIADIQILLDPAKTRSSNVVAVEVVHDVDQDKERASGVELALQRLLDLDPALGTQLSSKTAGDWLDEVLDALGLVGDGDVLPDVGHGVESCGGDREDWRRPKTGEPQIFIGTTSGQRTHPSANTDPVASTAGLHTLARATPRPPGCAYIIVEPLVRFSATDSQGTLTAYEKPVYGEMRGMSHGLESPTADRYLNFNPS
jgi:hypothetical protein